MPKLDNLRLTHTGIDSQPFVIAGPDGKLLFAGRIRLVFNATQTGVQIIELNAKPGVKIIDPDDGFLHFISQFTDHDAPHRA